MRTRSKRFPPRNWRKCQQLATEFGQPLANVAALYEQAHGNEKEARYALTLARTYGQGHERSMVRTPQEILTLKQRYNRLTWMDIKECLIRNGDLFRPVEDTMELFGTCGCATHGIGSTRFSLTINTITRV